MYKLRSSQAEIYLFDSILKDFKYNNYDDEKHRNLL